MDILVDTNVEMSLFDLGAIRAELTELLGVDVEVVTPGALPDRWKLEALAEARAI